MVSFVKSQAGNSWFTFMATNPRTSRTTNALSGLITDLDLRLLRVFKTVVECGGFAAAEVELNITRSAISRYMGDLETRLHMHLCYRGRSGFSLTEQGRLVYESLMQLQADLEKFRANINTAHHRLVGNLHIGVTDNTITDPCSRTASVIATLKQLGPEVQIVMLTTSPNEIERLLIEGHLHIGIIPSHQTLPGLAYLPLYQETSYLYCAQGHPLFSWEETLVPALLAQYEHVSPGYKPDAAMLELQAGLKTAAHAYQMEGVATLIMSGAFIGFLPEHYARYWEELGLMRKLLPEQFSFSTGFKAVWRDEVQPNRLRAVCLEELRRSYGLTE
ncbi:LysR family transcriptional regulator [Oceanimonas sp. CHS3-5]|uniref:LysR family transcriptional regulator n=1 Tax=Oceanimonas sp. CHS3-5 TaxID=3068186 RepID=UPI00273DFC1C|nr:LysR family transcriptional regulator [Oceanimonas sp. CHS3-5]MDP5291945.1 LysR family transcriptional regulator [Oceanimonas sp. CHS3-5]